MRTIGDKKILSRGGRDGTRIRAGPRPVLAGWEADELIKSVYLILVWHFLETAYLRIWHALDLASREK